MDALERDLAALQGIWEQVGFEGNGVADAPDGTDAPGALTHFSSNRFSVHTLQGELLLEVEFELDASAGPGAITWIDAIGPDAGKRLPASYRLEGDRFVFIAADEGAPRPTEFRTVPGLTLGRFVRRHAPRPAVDQRGA